MLGGVAGLLLAAALLAWLLLDAAEARAAAWRVVALRPREPAPARARVEPADRCACAGNDGAAAADRRARRSAARLARESAARRAQPVPRQRAARPGRRRARVARRRRSTSTPRIPADGARPARRAERHGARHDALRRHARAPARRARVQPVVDGSVAGRQSRRQRRVLVAAGARRRRGHVARGRHRANARRQARRHG